jgi:hypothetical protein
LNPCVIWNHPLYLFHSISYHCLHHSPYSSHTGLSVVTQTLAPRGFCECWFLLGTLSSNIIWLTPSFPSMSCSNISLAWWSAIKPGTSASPLCPTDTALTNYWPCLLVYGLFLFTRRWAYKADLPRTPCLEEQR